MSSDNPPLSTSELRSVQLKILGAVDGFCRRSGITYYLTYGTLLGAVRHDGYIPWDDDIDLMMPRDHYDVFMDAFSTSPEAAGLSVGDVRRRADWPFPFAKVWDDRTRLVEDTTVEVQMGVNVDVFPVDGVSASPVRRLRQSCELAVWQVCLSFVSTAPRAGRSLARRLVLGVGKLLTARIGATWVANRIDRTARRFPVTSSHVGVRVGSFDWSVPRAQLGSASTVRFEGADYAAPQSATEVLTTLYGDYASLPPVDERVSHHKFSATWR